MTDQTAEKTPDLDEIVPDVVEIDVDGIPCRVRRLKTREFLALMRVLTSGLGGGLSEVKLDFTDSDAVGRDLSALMLLALPNAFEEFTQFLTLVVEPKDGRKTAAVRKALDDNPDPAVLLDVFEAIAVQEKHDLAALAGKAQAMWARVATLYSPK
jgi:hypothetical protein